MELNLKELNAMLCAETCCNSCDKYIPYSGNALEKLTPYGNFCDS